MPNCTPGFGFGNGGLGNWDPFITLTLNSSNPPPGFEPVNEDWCPGCYYFNGPKDSLNPMVDVIWDPSTQQMNVIVADYGNGGSFPIQTLPLKKAKARLPSCGATFVDALLGGGNAPPYDEAAKTAAEGAAAYLAAKAFQYEAENGLIVPLRSGFVRALVGASEMFATTAEVTPLLFVTYEWMKATLETAKANSNGACRPVLSRPTHP